MNFLISVFNVPKIPFPVWNIHSQYKISFSYLEMQTKPQIWVGVSLY